MVELFKTFLNKMSIRNKIIKMVFKFIKKDNFLLRKIIFFSFKWRVYNFSGIIIFYVNGKKMSRNDEILLTFKI